MAVMTYRDAVKQSMRSALQSNPKALVYGLGVTDHIGIFGTTAGLESEFGADRVFDTPLAEESMSGFALGVSLGGYYPIHIHIRNDFMLLAMNQIVNSIAKYKSMYGGLFSAPMLIRAVIGRSWGQGGQHSQSLQALFSHIPGLTVVMPSTAQSLLDTYDYAVNSYRAPVISLEHRLLYDYSFHVDDKRPQRTSKNPFDSQLLRAGNDVTIVATSVMVEEALRAADYVKKAENIDAEIIDLHCLTHINHDLILQSVRKTGRLIVADTSWQEFGVCAEISRIIATSHPEYLKYPIKTIAMAKTTCPTAKALENHFYPDIGTIIDAIYELARSRKNHGLRLPTGEVIAQNYREFKGPF